MTMLTTMETIMETIMDTIMETIIDTMMMRKVFAVSCKRDMNEQHEICM